MKQSWRRLFSGVIWKRGEEYYRTGRVKALRQTGEGRYVANVVGSQIYSVTLNTSGIFPIFTCNCPHALGGMRCKHMAAVCMAIDEHPEGIAAEESAREKTVRLLDGAQLLPITPEKEDYRTLMPYYDLYPLIRNYSVKEGVKREALDLLPSCRLVDRRIHRSPYQAEVLEMCVGMPDPIRHTEIKCHFGMTRTRLDAVSCSGSGRLCDSYLNPDHLCAHAAAALLFAARNLREDPCGDATDYAGLRFLESFNSLERAFVGDGQRLFLEPMIAYDDFENGLSASFRLKFGKKSYIVKDIGQLVSACENHTHLLFGTQNAVDFSHDRFDETAQPLYDFILAAKQSDESARMQHITFRAESRDRGAVLLFGSRLDDFYMLCLSSSVLSRQTKAPLVQKDAEFRPEVTLSPMMEGKRFIGIEVDGETPEQMVLGQKYAYEIRDDAFVRLDIAPVREWNRRIPNLNRSFSLKIGRRYLPDFYRRVYPFLKRSANVTEKGLDQISELLPPACEITFYLDVDGDDLVCRVEAAYGEEKYVLLSRAEKRASWRDEETETRALMAAMRIFPSVDEEKRRFSVGRSEDAVYSVLSSGLGELEALGRVMCTEAFLALRIRRKWNLQTGVRMDNGLLSLDIESSDLTREELLDVLEGYRQKKKYHRLKNGDFIDLTGETTETLYQLMLAAHASPKEFVSGKMHLPAYRALYLDTTLREHEEIVSSRDAAFRQLIRTFKTVNESDFEVPQSLRGVLRPYQTAGFKWMMTLASAGFGGILADDMGLGKTLQMIAVLLGTRGDEKGVSLIVCPASLVYNWQAEFRRFAPQMDVRVISGNAPERKNLIEGSGDADVLITSYDLLKRDLPLYEGIQFCFEVLDEAQYIKNASAAAARSVKIIRAHHRFALTGTPIENTLSELWSIFDYLMPGFLFTYSDFRTAFEGPIVKSASPEASVRLKKMVSPFILRRLKQDVLKDLPDKLEESRIVMMEEDQRRLYDGQVLRLRQLLEETRDEEFGKSRIRVLAELTRLRQLCCDPALTAEGYGGTSCKRAALMDLVREAISGGHKMLIFSQFTSMLELIRADLDAEGISYDHLTGATPKAKRLEMVNAFNQDDVPVFLISLKAGGTGLNLVGADVVVHVDPWWNAAAQNQATDRAHRIGQKRTVTVFRLICKNTIEEKIAEMQENKSALAEEILSGENGHFASLSRDDLMALISGDA